MATTLYIKNMVCPRCIEAVVNIMTLEKLNIDSIELGKVITTENLPEDKLQKLNVLLEKSGFNLLLDKEQQTVDWIKSIIIGVIHHAEKVPEHLNVSEMIVQKIHKDYKQLSSLFSKREGMTIEKYMILQRIERVKELISYNELNFSEIADHLGYGSVNYLSLQFKKITGLTPSQYAKLSSKNRISLDNIS